MSSLILLPSVKGRVKLPWSVPEMVHIRQLIGLRLVKTCTDAGTSSFCYCQFTTTHDWEMLLNVVHNWFYLIEAH